MENTPTPRRPLPWLPEALLWSVPALVAWIYYCSLRAASWVRVVSLSNVENYALATYNQLCWYFAFEGRWAQTIHSGYEDAWMWSGHRSVWLPVAAWIYSLDPGPIFLCRIQIAVVALGVLPAWGLGRLAIGGALGGAIGAMLYAGFPPLLMIALNDYQDVVLGVPFIVATLHQLWRRSPVGVALAMVGMCAAREEYIVMAPLMGLAAPGGIKARLKWTGVAAAIAGVFGGVVWWISRDFTGHDNPMTSHVGDLLTWPPPITRTWRDVENFYQYFLRPAHFTALLAPITLGPAAGALFFHLTAPADGGVDTTWRNHIHHMAPVAGFVIGASIVGLGNLIRLVARAGERAALAARVVALVALTLGLAATLPPWMEFAGIEVRATRTLPSDAPIAPEWALLADVPRAAPIATDVHASVMIATRARAYTYDESLQDKAPGMGLTAVDYALIRWRDTAVLAEAQALGWKELGRTPQYVLMGKVEE